MADSSQQQGFNRNNENDNNNDDAQYLTAKHYSLWGIIKTYWQSDQRIRAYVYSLVVIFMTIMLVMVDVAIN